MSSRRFDQVDVFAPEALAGNPLAVVHDADGLDDARMAALARWTNLSETTFLLPPTEPGADYRVRIWTPHGELPFAGHPTLGSAWAWLDAGGAPRDASRIVQQCGVGLVELRRDAARLAFAAPPLRRSGTLEPDVLARIVRALRLADADVAAHQWVDNGPGWCAVLLRSADAVLAIEPDWRALGALKLGVVGPYPSGGDVAFELRAFFGTGESGFEDPVTGSLNASVAQWLIGEGLAPARYVASQGTRQQRRGRVHLASDGGQVWVGGEVRPVVQGIIAL